MTRPIKFRAKSELTGQWIYGDLLSQKEPPIIIEQDEKYKGDFSETTAIRESVGQFTGMLDKNGTEIYEGDIVRTGTDKLMVITWSKRFASFCIERDGWGFSHWFGEAFEATDCEVVGNIFDNSELLK